MSATITKLLAEQRKRLLASVMRAAEAESWWGLLASDERERYRTTVVTSINVFYDFCRDVIKVSDEDSISNDASMKLLAQVHSSQRSLQQIIETQVRAVRESPAEAGKR